MPELLREAVNPSVIEATSTLAESFGRAKPFRHIAIDEFFRPELAQSLVKNFPGFDEKRALNENGVIGNKAVNEDVKSLGAPYLQLDELFQSEAFKNLVSQITGISKLCYDPHYFGGGTHENRHGQSLDAHVDFNFHPITRQHRRLNLIFYLTQEWKDEWGSSIQLH